MISINLENHVSERRVISAALEIDTINHSTQYAHVYYNGRAFATISARRVLATGKRWTVTDTNGAVLFEANFAIEFANDAFRRRLVSLIHDLERGIEGAPGKSDIVADVAAERGLPLVELPVSEFSAADLSGMPELIDMAERAAAGLTSILQCLACGRDYKGDETLKPGDACPASDCPSHNEMRLNPARAALTCAVNASIAAGNPVFENMPAAAAPVASGVIYNEQRPQPSQQECEEMAVAAGWIHNADKTSWTHPLHPKYDYPDAEELAEDWSL